VTVAVEIDPPPVIAPFLLRERPDLQLLAVAVERLDSIIKTLVAIETHLAAAGPQAGDGRRAAASLRTSETGSHLAALGIEPAVGPGAWPAILGRSRRETDRMRSSGRLPPPDFYCFRSPRWRAQTVRDHLARQGVKK
jgi:hypothetical protein